MNQYVTGTLIKQLRETRNMTQLELATLLNVSDKTISKWETAKGYPDITLLSSLAQALGVSIIELLSGSNISNTNPASNMLRSKLYVCPICGNVIQSTGEVLVSCHGVTLPALEAESPDNTHQINVTQIDDEYYVTVNHDMSKEHYISFIAAVSDYGIQLVKMYPEGPAEASIKIGRTRTIYAYCNQHGLFYLKV